MVEPKFTEPDIYGQKHPIETPELIKYKSQELEKELDKIDHKPAYDQAKEKCAFVNEEFKLMFLRCEVFHSELAAQRLVRYWEKRVTIFGPEKAFLPMTQSQGLKDDAVALSLGIIQLTGTKDPSGRSIVFFDPSKQDKTKYTQDSFARCVWYILHTALQEDVETQQHGIVFCIYTKEAKFSQFDRNTSSVVMGGIKGSIPVRVSAFHLCNPPSFFSLIFPFIKVFMGERLRKRVRVHSGQKIISKLEPFGLTRENCPVQLGGNITMNLQSWLKERKDAGK